MAAPCWPGGSWVAALDRGLRRDRAGLAAGAALQPQPRPQPGQQPFTQPLGRPGPARHHGPDRGPVGVLFQPVDPAPAPAGAVLLLLDVGELVGDQRVPAEGARLVLARGERDVLADRERPRAKLFGQRASPGVGVHPCPAEAPPVGRLQVGPYPAVEGLPGAEPAAHDLDVTVAGRSVAGFEQRAGQASDG
jgi:hypothetical protein